MDKMGQTTSFYNQRINNTQTKQKINSSSSTAIMCSSRKGTKIKKESLETFCSLIGRQIGKEKENMSFSSTMSDKLLQQGHEIY